MRWFSLCPSIGYHHVLIMILGAFIILVSVLIAGCTSEGLSGIYLLSLSYEADSSVSTDSALVNSNITTIFSSVVENSTSEPVEVRAGYLGICILLAENQGQWICSRSSERLARIVLGDSSASSPSDDIDDPLNLIYVAGKFKDDIVFEGLLYIGVILAFITIILLMTYPRWHTQEDSEGSEIQVKVLPNQGITLTAVGLSFIASVMTLMSAFWQHLSSSASITMVQALTYGAVTGHVGAGAMSIGWVATALCLLVFIGVTFLFISVALVMAANHEVNSQS